MSSPVATLRVNDRVLSSAGEFVVIAVGTEWIVFHPLSRGNSLFLARSCVKIQELLANGQLVRTEPSKKGLIGFCRTKTMESKARHNYELIEPLVSDMSLYLDVSRWKEIRRGLSGGDPARLRKINRLLIRYWRDGLCIDALLPRYGGNKGKKYIHHKSVDINISCRGNKEALKKFIERCILCPKGLSLRKGFEKFCQEVFGTKKSAKSPRLTFRQFRYFYETEWSEEERERLRGNETHAST